MVCCPTNPIIATGECQKEITITTTLFDPAPDTTVEVIDSELIIDQCTLCPELNKVLVQGTLIKCLRYTTNSQDQQPVQRVEEPVSCCIDVQVAPFTVLDTENFACCAQGELVCAA